MATLHRTPLIDADGEARQPVPDDLPWAIRVSDFGSVREAQAFKARRAAIVKAGAAAGLAPEYFLQFNPAKPGFEDRIAAALGPLMDSARHAAE